MKTYTLDEIFDIIDEEIKAEMEAKNRYIERNGYSHKDTLKDFDARISALSGLYGKFN